MVYVLPMVHVGLQCTCGARIILWCTSHTVVRVDYLGGRCIAVTRLLLVPSWKYCASRLRCAR